MNGMPLTSNVNVAFSAITNTSLPPSGTARSPSQLKHAAGDFESILLGQWLQGAEDSFASVPGGDDDQDEGEEQMKGFAVQALARGITAAGGIGISALVSKALERTQADENQSSESAIAPK